MKVLKNKIINFFEKLFYEIIDFELFLYRPQYKIFNKKIEIHKRDLDTWPSFPHIHFLEFDLKLDIYTGQIYRIKTRKYVYDASKKDMIKLWSDHKFVDIVLQSRKAYRYGETKLPDLPIKWMEYNKRKLNLEK